MLRNVAKLLFWGTRLDTQSWQVFSFIRLFDEVRAELLRDTSILHRYTLRYSLHRDIFICFICNFLEEERTINQTCLGFEPTHLCSPSDQRRLYVEGFADCATATQGGLKDQKNSYEIMPQFRTFGTQLGTQVRDFSACYFGGARSKGFPMLRKKNDITQWAKNKKKRLLKEHIKDLHNDIRDGSNIQS